ncbi:MAG: hypothetical protein AB9M60_06065 [Leptothrix sp. (in: b-proteobacteria)]
MHLLIPHASALGDAADAALALLAQQTLPNLAALLGRLQAEDAPDSASAADEYSLNLPHERATLALAGWPASPAAPDGQLPWAAWLARRDGVEVAPGQAIALVTPVHWHVGSDQISLIDPAQLALDEAESRAHLAVLQTLVAEAGWLLTYGAPLRWYATHPLMGQVRSASIERVVGRNIDLWLPRDVDARIVRRLQVELQMTLHGHALSEAREARGALPVNSFWLSGSGIAPAAAAQLPAEVTLDARLGAPLLAGDWQAWCNGWRALDVGPIAALLASARAGAPVTLTLCGERQARRWTPRPLRLLEKLGLRSARANPIDALRSL